MNLLIIDSSTHLLTLAVQRGGQVWSHEGAGGATASAQLLGHIQRLMQEAQLEFHQLHAIGFGAGPGAFTGLRAALAVAQGLGFGAGVPLLPIHTLGAMAWPHITGASQNSPVACTALLDARMGEVYWAHVDAHYTEHFSLTTNVGLPQSVPYHAASSPVLVGNVFDAYGACWPTAQLLSAQPHARQMLPLAQAMYAKGLAVAAQDALPLYVRDKVAQTTAERQAQQAEKQDALLAQLFQSASSHPWSAAQVRSSRLAGHRIYQHTDPKTQTLLGAAIVMHGVDEAELLNVVVAPAQRRSGIARRMLQHILKDAKAAQQHSLLLEVASHNLAALGLYQQFGAVQIAKRTAYYPDGADALVLKCVL